MLSFCAQLFDFIADCMAEFLKRRGLSHSRYKLPLGFTFSFPCEQRSLKEAHLTHWTKGFCCEGVEGVDVGGILQAAIERRRLPVECLAVLNDTTGTLMSCAITETQCRVGAIFGALSSTYTIVTEILVLGFALNASLLFPPRHSTRVAHAFALCGRGLVLPLPRWRSRALHSIVHFPIACWPITVLLAITISQ